MIIFVRYADIRPETRQNNLDIALCAEGGLKTMDNIRDIETNIEVITREIKLAYNKGRDIGYAQGYKRGIADGNIADGTLEKKIKVAYENGLKDAWSATRKIILTADDGGVITTKIHDMFNTSPYGVIKGFEAKEVIEKLKEENSHEAEWIIDYQKFICTCAHCGFIETQPTKHCVACGYTMKNAKVNTNEA